MAMASWITCRLIFITFIIRMIVAKEGKSIIDNYIRGKYGRNLPVLQWKSTNQLQLCSNLLLPHQQNDVRFMCASMDIPYDYREDLMSFGNLTILRFRPYENVTKSLFMNPGGPGGLGSKYLSVNVALFEKFTAGQYELIGWDPRGMGTSGPGPVRCFASPSNYSMYFNKSIVEIPAKEKVDETDLQLIYSSLQEKFCLIPDCELYSDLESLKFSKYFGSYFNAMDLEFMRRMIAPHQPLNFHGVSYGTVFGAYYLSLFPEQIGRIVLDGVVDVKFAKENLIHSRMGMQSLGQVEELLQVFFENCVRVGTSKCHLSKLTADPHRLAHLVSARLERLYYHPIRASETIFDRFQSTSDLYIRIYDVATVIFNALVSPCINSAWQNLGETLFLLLQDDVNRLYSHIFSQTLNVTSSSEIPLLGSTQTIRGDGPNDNGVKPMDVLNAIKRIGLPTTPHLLSAAQSFFDFSGSRSYPDPLRPDVTIGGYKLKSPVLLIGNRLDPVTPGYNAKRLADLFGPQARVYQHQGIGHTSLAQPSDCTIGLVARYLTSKSFPEVDRFYCSHDLWPLFGPSTNLTYI